MRLQKVLLKNVLLKIEGKILFKKGGMQKGLLPTLAKVLNEKGHKPCGLKITIKLP